MSAVCHAVTLQSPRTGKLKQFSLRWLKRPPGSSELRRLLLRIFVVAWGVFCFFLLIYGVVGMYWLGGALDGPPSPAHHSYYILKVLYFFLSLLM